MVGTVGGTKCVEIMTNDVWWAMVWIAVDGTLVGTNVTGMITGDFNELTDFGMTIVEGTWIGVGTDVNTFVGTDDGTEFLETITVDEWCGMVMIDLFVTVSGTQEGRM